MDQRDLSKAWGVNMGNCLNQQYSTQPQEIQNGTIGYPKYSTDTPAYPRSPLNFQQTYSHANHLNTGIPGRIVQSENDILPNEIPMNGGISLFPLADGSAIIAKKWNSQGTIDTATFVLDIPELKPVETNNYQIIMERLDNIEKLVSKPHYNKPFNKPNKPIQNKEENKNE